MPVPTQIKVNAFILGLYDDLVLYIREDTGNIEGVAIEDIKENAEGQKYRDVMGSNIYFNEIEVSGRSLISACKGYVYDIKRSREKTRIASEAMKVAREAKKKALEEEKQKMKEQKEEEKRLEKEQKEEEKRKAKEEREAAKAAAKAAKEAEKAANKKTSVFEGKKVKNSV